LTPAEDSVEVEVAENSSKSEVKVAETKRPKRQAAALDKVKVIVAEWLSNGWLWPSSAYSIYYLCALYGPTVQTLW